MTRVSSLIFATVTAFALASPALAKTTISQGENLCKAEVKKSHTPKSIIIVKDETKATSAAFVYTVKIKDADDAASKVRCTVDRESNAVVVAAN